MTNWSSINSFESLLLAGNAYSPFWTAMFFMMWVVILITFMPFGFSVAVYGGCFLSFIIGLFLVYMNLMNWKWLLMVVGMIIAMAIWDTMFARKD